ncbi:MAG: class I SAM-dependent methyltransferase, partial [Chthoniobacteraceae bacterium]
LSNLLPSGNGIVLDVGAGTGRDAAWLASRGLEVVAVEPSTAMREEARRRHADARIQWINDSLPDFRQASRLGLTFDFILLSAVWMHIPESDRARAFRKLVTLLKPGGVIAMSLRQGPADSDRGMHPVSEPEIERLAIEQCA